MVKSLVQRLRTLDLMIRKSGPNVFVCSALLHYGLRVLFHPLRRRKIERTADFVRTIYDTEAREEYWAASPSAISFDNLVYDDSESQKYILYGGKIIRGTAAQTRTITLNALAERIGQYLGGHADCTQYVVEFGAGSGRNILFLKQKFPQAGFIGLELSPKNVCLANSNARRYGIDVQFYQANICGELPRLPEDVIVSFSCHALEQIPRVFPSAVDNMLACAGKAALFYEPCYELYPLNLRGFASRLRIINADYIRGLYRYLSEVKGHEVVVARTLGTGTEPFNETCEIVVVKN